MKQSTKRLLSVFMCVTVLTSTAFVSGCSLSRTVGKISSAAEKASSSQVENFNKLIDAENNYIDFRLSFGGKEKQFNDGLRNGVYDQSFVAPDYKSLQEALKAVKAGGATYKTVDAELDNVLSALDELVPVATDLQTYYESKTYLNDNYTKVKEVAPKYLAAVDKFNAAMDKLDDAIEQVNQENSQKEIEQYKSAGKKNMAAALEATVRFKTIMDELGKHDQNPDKAKIEQELGAVSSLLGSISSSEGDLLKSEGNELIGDIREFMADPDEENREDMYEQYNSYVNAYNGLNAERLDGK